MIQDIVPHRYDNTYKIQTPHAQDILLYYQKQDVLCQHTEQGDTLPRFELFADEVKEKAQYLFSIDDVGFYLVKQLEIPEGKGLFMQPTRVFRNFEPQWMAFGGITGSQIYRWERAHKFCGKCGSVMKDSETERGVHQMRVYGISENFACNHRGHSPWGKIADGAQCFLPAGKICVDCRVCGNWRIV